MTTHTEIAELDARVAGNSFTNRDELIPAVLGRYIEDEGHLKQDAGGRLYLTGQSTAG